MKANILLAAAAMAAATMACTINVNLPRLQTGPTETLTINEPSPDTSGPVDLSLAMGIGKLTLSGGAAGLVEGEVRYNVADWKPKIVNEAGALSITQGTDNNSFGLPYKDTEVVNEWSLKLGQTPLNLRLRAGAYEGQLDLSGVPLRRLQISDGASNAEVIFDELNPEEMTRLTYETGASTVKLTGLANANFSAMDFTGGAGSYVLDFSGELQREADVAVKAGASTVRLVVPEGTNVRVTVSGELNDISTVGSWDRSGDTYSLSGSGPLLSIRVEMGVGSLTLVTK